jgi:hypothetical protein
MVEDDIKKGFNINKTTLQMKRKSNANLRPQSIEENALRKHQKQ